MFGHRNLPSRKRESKLVPLATEASGLTTELPRSREKQWTGNAMRTITITRDAVGISKKKTVLTKQQALGGVALIQYF